MFVCQFMFSAESISVTTDVLHVMDRYAACMGWCVLCFLSAESMNNLTLCDEN